MNEYTDVCPGCGAVTHSALGMMGRSVAYRCRYCGMVWTTRLPTGAVETTSGGE